MTDLDLSKYNNSRFGLIAARRSRNMTQQELADSIGYSRSMIAGLETDGRGASEDVWKRLKKVLQVRYVEEIWEKYTYVNGRFVGDDGSIIEL